MTLQEFFNLLSDNPFFVLAYFILIPVAALIAGVLGKGEGHLSPWTYFYAVLIYLVCVPGIFSITLNAYLFLFENRPVLSTNIYTQILPIISMVVTLFLIRKNTILDYIPGFDKLSGLLMLIFVVLSLMWVLDKTRIFVVAFTHMPFYLVILIFVGLLVVFRFGMSRFTKS